MKGIDISNNNSSVDFNSVKSDGVEVIYIKATEGTTYQDACCNQFYQGAKAVGLKTGFYHFFVGTSAPESQADNFYKQIKDKENDLIPMLDIETNFEGLNDYIGRFISRFKQISNLDIAIYTYTSFISNISSQFADLKLWEANYNNNPWNLPSNFFATRIGHQYTEKGNINGVGACDVNDFTDGVLLDSASNTPQPVAQGNQSVNVWVSELQAECNRQGFSCQTVDGVPGPNTLKGCPLLKVGAMGNITKLLQQFLGITADGIFGEQTRQAVIQFQNTHGLQADGVVGQNTWCALLGI